MKYCDNLHKFNPFNQVNKDLALLLSILCLILSLLFMRIISMAFLNHFEMLPLRIVLTFGICFNFIIPILLVYLCFRNSSVFISICIPFFIYSFVYPVLDSVILGSPYLIFDASYISPLIIGGVGFALIGIGGYLFTLKPVISGITFICGLLIIVSSALNIIPVTYYIITGDFTILKSIPNFI